VTRCRTAPAKFVEPPFEQFKSICGRPPAFARVKEGQAGWTPVYCGLIMRLLTTIACLLWPFPWTLLGCLFGLAGIVTGGSGQRIGRVIEFHGGLLKVLLRRVPIAGGAAAMTLGHCVIARTKADLDRSRRHELVHVAQYERWGLLFVPAYLA